MTEVKSLGNIAQMALPPKKFCVICSMEQPYRTKHCKDCEKCVRKFDHHCFWVGGCVGELNHRKFWAFLFLQTITFCVGFDITINGYGQSLTIYKHDTKMLNHVSSVWTMFAWLGGGFIVFTGGLWVYHTFLLTSS
mmetsp:Transcript_23884/g.23566  ORF Transcript_23884/g.23566 Transcript_23884/m.23566 type:complete len:136 (-) Transcript_23884:237-644(-)